MPETTQNASRSLLLFYDDAPKTRLSIRRKAGTSGLDRMAETAGVDNNVDVEQEMENDGFLVASLARCEKRLK